MSAAVDYQEPSCEPPPFDKGTSCGVLHTFTATTTCEVVIPPSTEIRVTAVVESRSAF